MGRRAGGGAGEGRSRAGARTGEDGDAVSG